MIAKNGRQVWMIIPTFHPVIGGSQSQVLALSKNLQGVGKVVRILTRRHSNALPNGLTERETIEGVPVNRLNSRGRGRLGTLRYLLNGWWYLFLNGRNGIYHANSIGAEGWMAVLARYLLGGRSVVKMRTGTHVYEHHYQTGFPRWQFITLLRLADRVHVVSSELKGMVHGLGVPSSRVVLLPNVVDTETYRPASAQERKSSRERLGIPKDKKVVLWVGRLEHVKGLDLLLHSWALIPDRVRAGAILVLVGDGSKRELLNELSSRLHLAESIKFIGSKKQVRECYWAADIFVLPSRAEGLSGALIEAMACELPVIASNVGGAQDVVVQGKNGELFEPEDQEQLALKLSLMLTEPHRWSEMGHAARRTVCEYADISHVMDTWQQVYYELS